MIDINNLNIHCHPHVRQIWALHPYVGTAEYRGLSVRDQLAMQAETLVAAHGRDDPRANIQISNWWPAGIGYAVEINLAAEFSLADSQETLAREHGFASRYAISGGHPDPEFEAAIDAVTMGDVAALTECLAQNPDIVRARSCYGHGATLLHYIAANGVETYRQFTPLNAPEIAQCLLDGGADAAATANMYGGGQTALTLAESSVHPRDAGVLPALVNVLRRK